MKYREIPHTDLRVSLIGLGTMTWGEQNSQEEAFEQMDYALEQGVTCFDTAEMYPVPPIAETCHRTETIIGNWFSESGKRDEVILATKVAGPGPHITHIRGGSRHNREHITAAIEGSLKRLQTDRIDLYQLHWPDRKVPIFGQREFAPPEGGEPIPPEETLQVLADLIAEGKIRYVGLSNETTWGAMKFLQVAESLGLPRMVTVQNSYNLLNRTFDSGLSEICYQEGLRSLPYSPLAFGRLSGKYRNGARPEGARLTLWERFARYNGENSDAAVDLYAQIAEEAGLDFAQMSLAWVNSQHHVASNLIGATTMEQLRSNIASVEVELSDEVLRAIDEVHARFPNPCP